MFALNKLKVVALQTAINQKISKYGSVVLDECDFQNGLVCGRIALHGEDREIAFTAKYSIFSNGEGAYLRVSEASISRSWMQGLCQDYVIDRDIAISDTAMFFAGLL